jgi:hypothetical protein
MVAFKLNIEICLNGKNRYILRSPIENQYIGHSNLSSVALLEIIV